MILYARDLEAADPLDDLPGHAQLRDCRGHGRWPR